MNALYTKLLFIAAESGGAQELTPVAFVIPRADGTLAAGGFATHSWIPDTLKWVRDNAPPRHLSRIEGLMLGYSPAAIAAHDEFTGGDLYPKPTIEKRIVPPDSPRDFAKLKEEKLLRIQRESEQRRRLEIEDEVEREENLRVSEEKESRWRQEARSKFREGQQAAKQSAHHNLDRRETSPRIEPRQKIRLCNLKSIVLKVYKCLQFWST